MRENRRPDDGGTENHDVGTVRGGGVVRQRQKDAVEGEHGDRDEFRRRGSSLEEFRVGPEK